MAGAGFKTFNTGDVLLASEVNTYLMQQTVMVFDDATARTSALGANVAEGMFSYLKDTNLTYRYDGSAWLSDAGTTSPLTTKGDLWTYSTTDARLPVGTDGHTLVADSAETTGLKWAAPASPAATNFTLLNSGGTSLSGSETSITGLSGYNKFLVRVEGASCAAVSMGMTLRINSDTTAGNHKFVAIYGGYATGSEFQSLTEFYLTEQKSPGTAADTMFLFGLIDGGNSSGVKTFAAVCGNSGDQTSGLRRTISGAYFGTSVISSIQLRTQFGTTFDAGTIFIYGAN